MKNRQNISRVFFLAAPLCAALMISGRSLPEKPVAMILEDVGQGAYRLDGHFSVEGSPDDAWKVLTDYEHMSRFVSSLRKSSVKESTANHVLLEQEAVVKEFIFSRHVHVLLQVTEFPQRRIAFEDVAHKDFYFYKGSWELENRTPGAEVIYHLNCKRRFVVPNFMVKNALKQSAENLLTEVRTEIQNRQERGPKQK